MAAPSRTLFAFLGVATFFEGFDFIAITQVLPEVRRTWGLTEAEGGLIIGFCNIGPVLAFLLVRQADRYGRARVLNWTILGFTLASLATAFSPNPVVFAVAQLIARTFLISEWALCMIYAAETWPAEERGKAIGALQALASVGAVVCAGLTPFLLTSPIGWRAVYVVGAIPLLFMAWARRALPESPLYRRDLNPEAPSLLRVLRSDRRKRVLQLAGIWFLTYVGTQSGITFWKEYALNEAELSEAQVGRTLAVGALLTIPLMFSVGRMLDRFGRRMSSLLIFPTAALGVYGSFTFTDPTLLLVSVTLLVFGCAAVLPVLEAYSTELFPTEMRSDAWGWANNLLARQANIFIPPVVGAMAGEIGWGPSVSYTSVGLIAALAAIWVWMPETRGRSLEETARG